VEYEGNTNLLLEKVESPNHFLLLVEYRGNPEISAAVDRLQKEYPY
jgi:hypothetical protein